jgi:hypothetical protein
MRAPVPVLAPVPVPVLAQVLARVRLLPPRVRGQAPVGPQRPAWCLELVAGCRTG